MGGILLLGAPFSKRSALRSKHGVSQRYRENRYLVVVQVVEAVDDNGGSPGVDDGHVGLHLKQAAAGAETGGWNRRCLWLRDGDDPCSSQPHKQVVVRVGGAFVRKDGGPKGRQGTKHGLACRLMHVWGQRTEERSKGPFWRG